MQTPAAPGVGSSFSFSSLLVQENAEDLTTRTPFNIDMFRHFGEYPEAWIIPDDADSKGEHFRNMVVQLVSPLRGKPEFERVTI